MLTLRDGSCTRDPRLDRIRQVDLGTLNYPISSILTADQYRTPRSYTWSVPMVLNQGQGSSCVGHGWAHELAARPGVVRGVDHAFAVDIYHGAQRRDPWPGGEYEGASPVYAGSSVQAGAEEVKALGFIDEYRWAFTIADLITAIGYHGPAVIGIDWYAGMFEPDDDGWIRPTGDVAGGHCVCLPGVRIVRRPLPAGANPRDVMATIDPLASYAVIQNSWGVGWGISGRARLSLVDLAVLWSGGEFVVPVTRHAGYAPDPYPEGV